MKEAFACADRALALCAWKAQHPRRMLVMQSSFSGLSYLLTVLVYDELEGALWFPEGNWPHLCFSGTEVSRSVDGGANKFVAYCGLIFRPMNMRMHYPQ